MTSLAATDEPFAIEAFSAVLGRDHGARTTQKSPFEMLAIDPAHIAALIKLKDGTYDEGCHVLLSAEFVIRAAAALGLVYPGRDLLLVVDKREEFPVVLRTAEGDLGILLAPRLKEQTFHPLTTNDEADPSGEEF